jgi:hypothetical protein
LPLRQRQAAVTLLTPDIPVLEKVIRSAVVYLFLLIAFRLAGKRQLGQMTAFDLTGKFSGKTFAGSG